MPERAAGRARDRGIGRPSDEPACGHAATSQPHSSACPRQSCPAAGHRQSTSPSAGVWNSVRVGVRHDCISQHRGSRKVLAHNQDWVASGAEAHVILQEPACSGFSPPAPPQPLGFGIEGVAVAVAPERLRAVHPSLGNPRDHATDRAFQLDPPPPKPAQHDRPPTLCQHPRLHREGQGDNGQLGAGQPAFQQGQGLAHSEQGAGRPASGSRNGRLKSGCAPPRRG